MLSLDEARRLLLGGIGPLGAETVPIGDCAGRVLAVDIVAGRDQPPEPVSAMDGYAIRAADLRPGALLDLIGEAPAGAPFRGAVGPGQAVRIATGGVVPQGADHILIQEEAERLEGRIRVGAAPSFTSFVRPAGGDFRAGETLARAGALLTPARHALIAAANIGAVEVRPEPRILILPSGDELREPGSPLGPGEIANSATYAIAGLVARWGGAAARGAILPDDPEACETQLRAHDAADLIVTLGGASVGDRDSLRPIFEKLGAAILFDRIAVIPGKPSWHARFADGRLVLGLPGNPASAFVCAHLLLKPLLFALTGRDPAAATRPVPATLESPIPPNGPREAWWRAIVRINKEGRLCITRDGRQDSSLLTPLAAANALLRRPPHAPAAETGEMVDILPIEWIE